jgi:hypothetical protein
VNGIPHQSKVILYLSPQQHIIFRVVGTLYPPRRRKNNMTITTIPIEEAHCHICGHTWIIHNSEDRECPECRRRESEVTSSIKNRHLCIACHHVWMTGALIYDTFCRKCGKANEEGNKIVARDSVSAYTCGACGNEWVEESLFEESKDVYGSPTFLHKAIYCPRCGCGREKALEEKRKKDELLRKR